MSADDLGLFPDRKPVCRDLDARQFHRLASGAVPCHLSAAEPGLAIGLRVDPLGSRRTPETMSTVAAEGSLDVVTVYLLQTALPLLLILWLLLLPPRHGAGFWMLALAAAAMTVASEKLGIWVFPPWWVPHLMALALGGTLI
jgi:hypothetical protein